MIWLLKNCLRCLHLDSINPISKTRRVLHAALLPKQKEKLLWMICKNLRYSYLALELMNLLSKVRNIDQLLQIFSQNLTESLLIKTKKLQDLLNTQNKRKLFSTQHQSTHQQKLLLKTNFWLSILKIQDLGNTMPKYL